MAAVSLSICVNMLCCAVCGVQAMGDKTAARRAAIEVGVPIVPGTNQALKNAEEAKTFADEVRRI